MPHRASGLSVPSREVALSPDTAIESWAPNRSADVNVEVLEWIAAQMRGKRRTNRTLMTIVAALLGAAMPLAQSLRAVRRPRDLSPQEALPRCGNRPSPAAPMRR